MQRHFVVGTALLCAAALNATGALAAARTWPGAAPCNTTLQACLDAAGNGDVISVASNGPIASNLVVNKPLTLQAAPGFRPVLAADNYISASLTTTGGTWSLDGFTLTRGFINVSHGGGNFSVRIRHVYALQGPTGGGAEISINSTSATDPLSYDVSENNLSYAWSTYDGAFHPAIQIIDSANASVNGDLRYNRIDVAGTQALGVLINTSGGTHTARVFANQVRGGSSYGSIYLQQGYIFGGGSGTLNAALVGNTVAPLDATRPQGLALAAYQGALNLQAFNNTVTGSLYGISVYAGSGVALSGNIENNLLDGNFTDLSISNSGTGGVGNDYNLFYNGGTSGVTPGAHTLTADPRLRGFPGNARLAAGSPAIDAGDTPGLSALLASTGLPGVDADGLRRVKGGGNQVDIGAFEYGDTTFLHDVDNSDPRPDNYSYINAASLNAQPTRWPQATADWNPYIGGGIYNTHPTGMLYSSAYGEWALRTEDLAAFPDASSVNVFAPAAGNGSFQHVVSAGNISGFTTQLNDAGLNNQPNRVLLVTRDSKDPGGTIYDDPHPVGVFYFAFGGPGNWFISHLDSTTMNAGGTFHVYWQEPSANAFVYTAAGAAISGNTSEIDHPLLNGRACARFHVTQVFGGTLNPHQIGVYYTGARWAIFNQDGAAMPDQAQFHVVIDAQQVFECSDVIFADGFDRQAVPLP